MSKTNAENVPTEAPDKPPVLTLEYLNKIGAFVPEKPVRQNIEWGGEKIVVFVKVLSACAKADLLTPASDDERSAMALILTKTIFFDPDGEEPIKFFDAYRLVEPLMAKFLEAVNNVNGGFGNG